MDGQAPPPPAYCPGEVIASFYNNMVVEMWRINALLAVNAILMGAMVGIGSYGHRYRRNPFVRFIFLGASTLFLPIVSYVVSTTGTQNIIATAAQRHIAIGRCDSTEHITRVLVWTGLVQIAAINTMAIVAGDARERRNIGPPVVLLVQALWTSYLAVNYAGYQGSLRLNHPWLPEDRTRDDGFVGYNNTWSSKNIFSQRGLIVLSLFFLIFAKIIVKSYAWYRARQSLALGRNPCLIATYMEQVGDDENHRLEEPGHHIPPPLVVMGEDTVLLEKHSRGYVLKRKSTSGDSNGLVTLDRVWQSFSLTSQTQHKDLSFSLALFKLLRCRFARYTMAEAGFSKARRFLWNMLLEDSDGERVLKLIEHELSFLHDCYFSSLPISYSNSWLPLLSIFISLLSIGCCLITTILMFIQVLLYGKGYQIMCVVHCDSENVLYDMRNGNLYYDFVPVCLLLAVVLLTEVREIASYICSSWTKVALVCSYTRQSRWLRSDIVKKCVDLVLPHRCSLLRTWEDKMNQCSILETHRRKTPVALLRRLIPLPRQNMKVPSAVKATIVEALRARRQRRNGDGNGMVDSPRIIPQLQIGDHLPWTFPDTEGIADTILVCHIATSIFEVRSHSREPPSDCKTAAIHLSRYCAYLVACHPELLPDNDEWCKGLYRAVMKDTGRVLPDGIFVAAPEEECHLLCARSEHEVVRNGATLGRHLLQMNGEEEETIWRALAGFWSEMILYVAPSDNNDGHAEAIARGGELITILWALLAHLGIVSGPDDDSATPMDGGIRAAV